MEGDLIDIGALVKRYEGKDVTANAVDGISFGIRDGQFVTLLGPSGCGKTTTLRMIAGLERPSGGEIRIGGALMYSDRAGVVVPANRRPVGMVFQSYAIWPHLSVFENVAYPLRVSKDKRSKAEIRERTERALEAVGLAAYARRPGTALSGGQQQRAALARALVKEPQVLLLDEPLSNLDAKLRDRMREWIRSVQESSGLTTVYVTHDQDEALALSDRILVMDAGRIVEDGRPADIYRRPRSEFTAEFVGDSNRLPGVVTAVEREGVVQIATDQGDLRCHAVDALGSGEEVTVYIRPEDLKLSRTNGNAAWPGSFTRRLFRGAYWDYYVDVAGAHLRVRLYSELAGLEPDDAVYIEPHADKVIVVKRENPPAAP